MIRTPRNAPRARQIGALAGAALLVATLAACGQESEREAAENGPTGADGTPASGSFKIGTTETITAMDPAGSYDIGSWNMQYSIFEQLMVIPPGGDTPVADAAECAYDDPETISCTLREGITFSNGNELTTSDVEFSLRRNIEIADPNGSSVLLGAISNGDDTNPAVADGAIEVVDPLNIKFHLNQPDTTFLKILSTATASIVDEDVFPADALAADADVIGSGPYTVEQFEKGKQLTLVANDAYTGQRVPKTRQIFVTFHKNATSLKNAMTSGQTDIAWRTLSPTDLTDLEGNADVEVLRGGGSEFRYWVWQFESEAGGNQAVRQAVAQLLDRQAIADNAYQGTVTPSYSIVPPGFAGQKDSFQEKYGDPSVDAARTILEDAGVSIPVNITLGYTPTHYGPNAVDEARELADQLNQSGLFNAEQEDAEWEEYQTLYKQGAYDLFILGWYPDFLDADNYLSPFVRDGGFYANGYSNEEVNGLLDQELGETDPAARDAIIGQLQDIVAEDVPLIPSWNGENVAVAKAGMTGIEDTLDPTYIFRFWMVSGS